MNKRVIILTLTLALPLVLFGVPYAYASVTTSSYVIWQVNSTGTSQNVHCNVGDYATGGGGGSQGSIKHSWPEVYDFNTQTYSLPSNGAEPNAWFIDATDISTSAFVVCQNPITVAGITVPEFGSLYVAIALGALIYFMLARHFTRRPSTAPAQVKA